MNIVFSDPSIVVATKDQVSCPLGDGVVILDLKAGVYFSLDNVGATVWQLIQEPRTVREIRQAVLDTFDVAPEVCRRDILALLGDLTAKGLIDVQDAATV